MSLSDGAAWEQDHGWNQQPPPIQNNEPAAWDLVLKDLDGLKVFNPHQNAALKMVIADAKKRDQAGAKKYGTRLQPNNGRNAVKDAYEEMLDGMVYVRSAIEECRSQKIITQENQFKLAGLDAVYRMTVESAIRLRFILSLEAKELSLEHEPIIDTGDRRDSEELRDDHRNIIVP
jgi:hypothetical protein